MSLILDALKKSEKERHGDVVEPLLVSRTISAKSARSYRRRRQVRPIWIASLVVILISIALIWASLRLSSNESITLPETGIVGAGDVQPVDIMTTVASMPKSRQQIDDARKMAVSNEPPDIENGVEVLAEVSHEVIQNTLEPVVASSSEQGQKVIPYRMLPADERKALQPMHIDIHVYDYYPMKRYVYINGGLYSEGSTLKNGVEIIEIVPEGIVMESRYNRFLFTVDD